MRASRLNKSLSTESAVVVLLCAALIIGSSAGLCPALAVEAGTATFELFCMFPKQMVSPSTGSVTTSFQIEARNIHGGGSGPLALSAFVETPGFSATLSPAQVAPSGPVGKGTSKVTASCLSTVPDGTVGWIKITGKRGTEEHRLWLSVTALSSKPKLARGTGNILLGKGYKDAELKTFTGKPLTWDLTATNLGSAKDTFKLASSADFPCSVQYFSEGGAAITSVTGAGLTRNYLYPTAVNIKARVTPTAPLPKNQPANVTFVLGPGARTTETSQVTVCLVNPGMLFCLNDTAGLKPHPHQVLPGEKTTFVFHVTNLGSTAGDFELAVSSKSLDWEAGVSPAKLTALKPGATKQSVLTVKAPDDASVGARQDIEVTAKRVYGPSEKVGVAAEVTDQRNIYYWSVDSMDPAYLYMNKKGTGPGSAGDWLMPNHHAFLAEASNYENARCHLPSATDMNHTNALAGTYTGTSGVFLVGGTIRGFTEHDEPMNAVNSMGLMLYGPDGRPIERAFEVAKAQSGGKALCGFWSNKNWLTELEGERTVDIVGHSERVPLFFPPPRKYVAGDPPSDTNSLTDPWSGPFSMDFYCDTTREIMLPTLRGEFNLLIGLGIYTLPVSIFFGMGPGGHCEDWYLWNSVERSITEEDPDVSYINMADLDNTGHFTGASWNLDEWDTRGTAGVTDDRSKFSPWMRRDECLDIAREVDILFGRFIQTLKDRGVYDNSIVVMLSDHSMENMKDMRKGYEVLDLRTILAAGGYVYNEDYREAGGAGSVVWCTDPGEVSRIEQVLEEYTVNDPELGPVRPLTVVNRSEMMSGVDYGAFGKVLPKELYSEYWIANPGKPDGHLWPDLFVFPIYNYNICTHGQVLAGGFNPTGVTLGNIPDSVKIGFPAYHGGLTSSRIPLVFKAPEGWAGYTPASTSSAEVRIGDIAPTIYEIMGWPNPGCVDGAPLP
jgi:hypothetical protein